MAENLAANGLNIRTIPLVLQYNKRDLSNILPIEVMDKKLNFRNLPSYGAIAIDQNDHGVLDCFIAVLVAMVESFGEKYKIGKSSDEIQRITAKWKEICVNMSNEMLFPKIREKAAGRRSAGKICD